VGIVPPDQRPDPQRVAAIDALLPQTQCTRCGFEGCLPYARAMAAGDSEINRCPPGGDVTITRLAALLGREPVPLAEDCGPPGRDVVAWIDPQVCIGCARCLPPCPVDAIIGASRMLHTVMATHCTGCELCLPACPVDCIHLVDRPTGAMPAPGAVINRERYLQHEGRLRRRSDEWDSLLSARKQAARGEPSTGESS
jgi:electron transport complex protein RnfB